MRVTLFGIDLSFLMLAAFAWLGETFALWRKGARKQPVLVLALTNIAIGTVLIRTVPDGAGETPVERLEQAMQ